MNTPQPSDLKKSQKRKELTPEAKQEKEKLAKQYESINQHPSVLSLQSNPASPPLNIAKKCELAGISEAQPKVDLEFVYNLVLELSGKVSSLEDQLSRKDEELFNLRRDNNSLEKQLSDLRSQRNEKSNEEDEANDQFLAILRDEFPKLSDHVAKNENELNKLKKDVQDINDAREKDEQMVNEGDAVQFQQILNAQKEDRLIFENQNRVSHLEREQQSQYTMRETIRITGVPYKQGENTNDLICRIGCSIGVNITNEDISVSHRTGRRQPGRPRAIICKFTRRNTKYAFLRNRKLAKNITRDDDGNPVRIYIDEKLTPMRANVCKLLREQKIKHYTHDGKIFIPKENPNEYTVLDTPEDWLKWDKSVKAKMDLGVYPKY